MKEQRSTSHIGGEGRGIWAVGAFVRSSVLLHKRYLVAVSFLAWEVGGGEVCWSQNNIAVIIPAFPSSPPRQNTDVLKPGLYIHDDVLVKMWLENSPHYPGAGQERKPEAKINVMAFVGTILQFKNLYRRAG